MKLIDADKVIKWLHEVVLSELPAKTEGYDRGKEHMVQMLTSLINSGTFDPTPPVQPDTPTTGTEILLKQQAKDLAAKLRGPFSQTPGRSSND